MRRLATSLVSTVALASSAIAQLATSRPVPFGATVTKSIGYPYLLQRPADYDADPSRRFPLIIALHGSGECGTDLRRVANGSGLARLAATRPAFPFIVVSPQSPSEKEWFTVESLDATLADVLATNRVDVDRVYLTGLSMGGYATWDWACHRPDAFAAIAPIAGEGNTDFAADLRHVPVWAFHGGDDPEVSVIEERRMVDAVNQRGGDARLTVYPGVGHNAWERTYRGTELFDWFLARRRATTQPAR